MLEITAVISLSWYESTDITVVSSCIQYSNTAMQYVDKKFLCLLNVIVEEKYIGFKEYISKQIKKIYLITCFLFLNVPFLCS